MRIAQGGQFIGEAIGMGLDRLAAGTQPDLFQLQGGVLAQTNPLQQTLDVHAMASAVRMMRR